MPTILSLEPLEDRLLAFSVLGTVWPQPGGQGTPVHLSYSIASLADGGLTGVVSPARIHAAVAEALGVWAAHAPLHFTELPAGGDLIFSRADLPGNFAGQAYRPGPGLGGDSMIDDGRPWGLGEVGTLNLLQVLAHETGHALGIGHEPQPAQGGSRAIMNPVIEIGVYGGLGSAFLFPDDVAGIVALYGRGVGSVDPLDDGPEESPPSAFADEGVVSVHGFRDQALLTLTPFAGYLGHVSLGYDADGTLLCVADNGHVKGFDQTGRETQSRLLLGGDAFSGGHVSAGDLGSNGSRDAVVSQGGTVSATRYGDQATTFAPLTPYEGYTGEIVTSVAGGLLVTLATEAGHVKAFHSDGSEAASFIAFEGGYQGRASLGASLGTLYVVATDLPEGAQHVKGFDSSTFTLTASFIRR